MFKYIATVVFLCWMGSPAAHDAEYYRQNPNALQQALKACPEKQPSAIGCEQLKTIAVQLNDLAYQLRQSPQEYGKDILRLQEAIAKDEALLQAGTQTEIASLLDENKQELRARLAVVKWLESPTSTS